jgi:hypothetical protein
VTQLRIREATSRLGGAAGQSRGGTRHGKIFQPLALTGFLIATPVNGDAQQSTKWTQAFTLYVECLQELGMRGNYTWTDGGVSAIRLAEACGFYGKTVIDECIAMNFHPRPEDCQATNVLYAQTVLRTLHK